jgi:hypothetical protein
LRHWARLPAVLAAVFAIWVAAGETTAAPPSGLLEPLPERCLTDGRLAGALGETVSGKWTGVTLRSLVRSLARDRQVAVLLDRRVDPDQAIEIEIADTTLRRAFEQVAAKANAACTRVGNVLVIAPPPAAARLRTLAALRDAERTSLLRSRRPAAPARPRATVVWNDFDRPADVLAAMGTKFGLAIEGLDNVPHDLWAGALLPEVTSVEALSLALNQLDLTFEWTPGAAGVRLLPVPRTVAIERSYTTSGSAAAAAIAALKRGSAPADVSFRGGKLVLRGTLEEHETLAPLLRGEKPRPAASRPGSMRRGGPPLERQTFSLEVRDVSLAELLEDLRRQGVPLEYDAQQLRRAGVDLDRKVSLKVTKLPAQTFFARLLEPHVLTFRLERNAVIVAPK